MAVLSKGVDFTTGDQVSATNFDNLVDAATFASGAVDDSTTQLSSGAIIVKDGGITMAKLASASNGYVPIGNGTGFTAAALTAGTGISITNGAGTISITNTSSGIALARCTSATTVSSTSYSDITGMSVNVVSGTTYTLDTLLYITTAGSNIKLKLTGTGTVSSINGVLQVFNTSGGADVYAAGTSFPVEFAELAGGAYSQWIAVSVTFVCDGSGTMKWQIGNVSGADNSTANIGSNMKLFSY